MPSDYLPAEGQALCEWLENWKIEFAAAASTLGFNAAEITAVLTDANWALYSCRSASDAGSYLSAWVEFRDALLDGDPNAPVGGTPMTATPAAPAVPAPLRGIITRLRATVKRIKGAPAYTASIGEALRIVGTFTAVNPDSAKPEPRAKALPMFQAELRWARRGFSGVLVQSQRDGESAWTDLGVKTGKAFVDERAPQEANRPEVRRYRLIYLKDDQAVGHWSDVVSATVQP